MELPIISEIPGSGSRWDKLMLLAKAIEVEFPTSTSFEDISIMSESSSGAVTGLFSMGGSPTGFFYGKYSYISH
jgi:hypothetical protein